jgi:hypothetical protein
MITDTTDVRRRLITRALALSKSVHRWVATTLFLAGVLASSGVAAAIGEQFCTHGGQGPPEGR